MSQILCSRYILKVSALLSHAVLQTSVTFYIPFICLTNMSSGHSKQRRIHDMDLCSTVCVILRFDFNFLTTKVVNSCICFMSLMHLTQSTF